MPELIRVVYGRTRTVTPESCPHCGGTGQVYRDDRDRERRSYTYSVDEPVEVGDVVIVESGHPMSRGPQPATVVALGSDYTGEARPVLRVASRIVKGKGN